MQGSRSRCEGGEISETYSEVKTIVHHTVVMRMEVRAGWTPAPQESSRRWTIHVRE